MRRTVLVVVVLVALAGVGVWYLLRGTTVEVTWAGGWPETVRAEGEAVEPIAGGPDGDVSAGDRARAADRARWSAYYVAQLRLAERLGGLQLDATTTVRDLGLADQELRAAFRDTVQAAAEVDSSVEQLDDAVRATVVVEAPAARVASLRETLVRLARSGRISITRPAADTPEDREPRVAGVADESAASGGEVARPTTEAAADGDGPEPARRESSAPPVAPTRARSTGVVVLLDPASGFLGAAPDFYDGGGTFLGSTLELPPERRTAGLPVASSRGDGLVATWAGEDPMEAYATVSAGNVVLERTLGAEEARFFADSLAAARIVLVLTEEAS